ncbi:peroxiredoxin [Methylomonas sp. MED-D]|uniref:peroxiredoxin n=1 Tax=unclassified Methylomonas TaxID=2608980 RepID=UPI0028A4A080|nr:peroxiredoxin [Methylomonas sp. MV1]MDT4329480.1 peroxiredoxin [Methylomonas sp. MV1]
MNKYSPMLKRLALFLTWLPFASPSWADPPTLGGPAPLFRLPTHDGGAFDLAERRGKGWTVLYFYPKAGTPGCTTQACAFRDAIDVIRRQNAEVFGISTDSVAALQAFHREHRLNFTLLADVDALTTDAYGVKMPVLTMAKRRTFILDPELIVRRIDDDVDPALDAQRVADVLQKLQAGP